MTTEAGSRLGELVAQAREAASVLTDDDKDLRPIAFERVLEHLLGLGNGGGQLDGAPQLTQPGSADSAPTDAILGTEQQRVDAASRYFDIDPEQVRELFDLGGDDPQPQLSPRKLSKGKATAVREVALLVCGVRTAVGLETGTQHIRAAADTLDKLDPANFMKTLDSMPEIAVLGRRGSSNRAIRMKVTGAEAARPLAQRLVS